MELAPADRACVFLVDGLGWELLRAHPDEAPFLTSLLGTSFGGSGRPLTAGFPSTTATSLASVGTGLPPGAHGLAGYTVREPGHRRADEPAALAALDRPARLAAVSDGLPARGRRGHRTPARSPPRTSSRPRSPRSR